MKIIVGLGNPGSSYTDTRHNAGRCLVEHLARHHRASFSKEHALHASVATVRLENDTLILAYPEIFMNVSGKAVRDLVFHYDLDFKKDLLVAVDDVALPFGRLRLRPRGSDGGHNGLKSVQDALASTDYARLRLGIGMPDAEEGVDPGPLEEHVLERFAPSEQKLLPAVYERGREACALWMERSLDDAMHIINSYPAIG